MAKIFYQNDCDLKQIIGKKVAVIGYGSQGHAHALNLKESGVDVVVGLYEGSKSWNSAEAHGLTVMNISGLCINAQLSASFCFMPPDSLPAGRFLKGSICR